MIIVIDPGNRDRSRLMAILSSALANMPQGLDQIRLMTSRENPDDMIKKLLEDAQFKGYLEPASYIDVKLPAEKHLQNQRNHGHNKYQPKYNPRIDIVRRTPYCNKRD